MRPPSRLAREAIGILVIALIAGQIIRPWGRSHAGVHELSEAELDGIALRHTLPLVFPGTFSDTLYLFLDYRCPYCGALYPDVVRQDAPYGIVVVHASGDLVTPSHQAALAAECARSSQRFHAYSYALYARRDSIGILAWEEYAKAAGIAGLTEFSRCIELRQARKVLATSQDILSRIDLQGTPALLRGRRLIRGPEAIFKEVATIVRVHEESR